MSSPTLYSARARLHGAAALLATAFGLATRQSAGAQDQVEPANIRRPLTLMVGGLDSREPGQPENADVFMLARVDLQNRFVRAISIPRDLYVEIPGFGFDKITRAYDFGSKADNGEFEAGAATIEATVLTNFGLTLDGVVVTTFGGFVQIVDALGGVTVENPYDLYDGEFPTTDYGIKEIYYPAGVLTLSGEEALEFCRSRKMDGDEGRVMRQQLVIRGLLERARDPEIAELLPDLVTEYRRTVRTNLGPSKHLALALAAPGFSNESVQFSDLTGLVYADSTASGMWIYSGDWSQIPGYVEAFLSGAI